MLNKKILFTLLLFLSIILFFNINKVFASYSITGNYNSDGSYVDNENDLVDNGVLTIPSDFPSSLSYLFDYPFTVNYDSGNGGVWNFHFFVPEDGYDTYLYNEGSNQRFSDASYTRLVRYNTSSSSWEDRGAGGRWRYTVYNLLYTSSNIYTDSSKSDVFFQYPPPVEVILAPIVAGIPETKEVLQEIVRLLPVIVSVLVSFLALRKALSMLGRFLRAS